MPENENQLRESKLSTLYISNAYELFILNKRAALLDVNMARVLSRFFKPKELKDVRNDSELQELSKSVTNVKECKKLNWAILDFAAKVCKPKKPECEDCPLKNKCCYYKKNSYNDNLVKSEEPQLNIYYETNMNKDNAKKPLKLVSLFSGCGGMDIGFEGDFLVHKRLINRKHNPDFIKKEVDENYVKVNPTKFQTVFANDILKPAKHAWVNYFQKKGYSPEIFHLESLVELVKLHQQGVKIFPEKVDIVTGGFPCQDFSVSGKRSGFNSNKDHNGNLIKRTTPSVETRGKLYMWMKHVIDIVQPKIFVAENVKGLVNLENIKEVIQQDFASANGNGYIVLPPNVLHAANYGVPQSRERVFFIGLKKSELRPGILEKLQNEKIDPKLSPYPERSHSIDPSLNGYLEPVKVKEVFNNLEEPEHTSDLSQMYYSKAKFMGKHCQGQTEINPEKIGPTIRAEHHGNIEFRRLSIKNGGKNHEEIDKGLKERRLTPRECALIQSFPPDYDFVIKQSGKKFNVSASSAYKLIGNAVPPLLAYHLAKRIEKLWNVYFKE
jgi:DNA (cytosine-5)-methyltransferase 1